MRYSRHIPGKSHALASLLFMCVILLSIVLGCEKNDVTEAMPIDLNGFWEVYRIWYDNTKIDTFFLAITQTDMNVFFLAKIDTISTGVISGDTIRCGDMYGAGISMIFIDDEDHMHSEVPLCESLDTILFVRHSQ